LSRVNQAEAGGVQDDAAIDSLDGINILFNQFVAPRLVKNGRNSVSSRRTGLSEGERWGRMRRRAHHRGPGEAPLPNDSTEPRTWLASGGPCTTAFQNLDQATQSKVERHRDNPVPALLNLGAKLTHERPNRTVLISFTMDRKPASLG
jgi:hypothetical protein